MTARKLTVKQRAFAMAYVETGNAAEAYRQAYNAGNCTAETVRVKACELLQNGKVAVMVAELQAKHAARHNVTVDSLTAELEAAFTVAEGSGQASAMVSAVMAKAKLYGLVTDRKYLHTVEAVDIKAVLKRAEERLRPTKLELVATPVAD